MVLQPSAIRRNAPFREAKHFAWETHEAQENQKSGSVLPEASITCGSCEDPGILRGPVPGRESRALLQDSDGILDSVGLTRMATIFDHTLQDPLMDVLREAQARR